MRFTKVVHPSYAKMKALTAGRGFSTSNKPLCIKPSGMAILY